jgi:hypothetical protein
VSGESGFLIRPLMLDDAGAAMVNVVLNMDNALTQLQQNTEISKSGFGPVPPWGTDEVGAECGKVYAQVEETVYPAVKSYRHDIAGRARTLSNAAGEFLEMDGDGALNMAGLTAGLLEWRSK